MEKVSEKLELLMKYVDKPTRYIFEQLDSDSDDEITVRELVGSLTKTRVMDLFPDWPIRNLTEAPNLGRHGGHGRRCRHGARRTLRGYAHCPLARRALLQALRGRGAGSP